MSFEKLEGYQHGSFLRKLTSKSGKKYFFKVSAPMSLVKCHTPLDGKLHWAHCVKSNYNRMETFPIGETTHIVSNLQVWATINGSNLAREPTVSPVLTKWWNCELTLATNFGSHAQMVTKFGGQILAAKFGLYQTEKHLHPCGETQNTIYSHCHSHHHGKTFLGFQDM